MLGFSYYGSGPLIILSPALSAGGRLSGSGQDFMPFVQKLDHSVEIDTHLPCLRQQAVGTLRQNLQSFAPSQGRASLGYVGSRTVAFGDDAGTLQFEIRA